MASATGLAPDPRRQQNKGFVSHLFRKRGAGQPGAQSTFAAAGGPSSLYFTAPHYQPPAPPLGQAADGAEPPSRLALLQEVASLRAECARQGQQLQELEQLVQARDAENEALQQSLNLADFKYELLVDLWAMRVLDNEELGARAEAAGVAAGREQWQAGY